MEDERPHPKPDEPAPKEPAPNDHDSSYRRLFAEPRMIHDLVRGYLDPSLARKLDLGTLERFPEARVGARLRKRQNDIVWRIRIRQAEGREESGSGKAQAEDAEGDWLYLFLLLEFQSRQDQDMALRLLTYLCLFYQDLRRETRYRKGLLPPTLALVLYNGRWRWTAPTEVAQLIQGVEGIGDLGPKFRFLLLEEQRLPERRDNLASVLFGLERCQSPEEVDRRVAQLTRLLPHAEDQSLREAFMDFLRYSLLEARFPEAEIPKLRDLEEMRPMLRERAIEWAQEAREEGIREGLKKGTLKGRQEGKREGKQEGRQEGEASLLLRLLERRFGELPAEIRRSVETADAERLLELGERFVDAETLRDVFAEPS